MTQSAPRKAGYAEAGDPFSGGRAGKGEGEQAALARLALHGDRAAVGLGDVLDDREPQPGAAHVAAAPLVHAVEPLEDARQVLALDAGSLVADLDDQRSVAQRRFHRHRLARLAVLHRVVHEVDERLFEQRHVDLRAERFLAAHADGDVFPVGLEGAELDRRVEHGADGGRLGHHRPALALLLELREEQQVVDDGVEPVRLPGDDAEELLGGLRLAHRAVEQRLHEPLDRGDRRAEFVGDVRDEIAPEILEPADARHVVQDHHRAHLPARGVVQHRAVHLQPALAVFAEEDFVLRRRLFARERLRR